MNKYCITNAVGLLMLSNAANAVIGDFSNRELELMYNLPAQPDKKINNSTMLGVDANNMRGRDDLERKITFQYYKKQDELQSIYLMLESYSHLYTAIEQYKANLVSIETVREASSKLATQKLCYISQHDKVEKLKAYSDLNYIENEVMNTDMRDISKVIAIDYSNLSYGEMLQKCH
jgi:hypothetical protein